MKRAEATPLGYVKLGNGDMAIFPMNDILLNFTFQFREYWEALRSIINIVIMRYKLDKPDTLLETIDGDIEVLTQYKFLLAKDPKFNRRQDIKVTELGEGIYFIEFQNRAKVDMPISGKSVEYFGLAIGHAKGLPVNQIWFLAEPVPELLHGAVFSRYVLKDEITGRAHPESSGIMYVDLSKLSEEESQAGELAAFLLGKNPEPQDPEVKRVAAAFSTSFQVFRADKEVEEVLTAEERGRVEGIAIGVDRLAELIKSGLSVDEAIRKAKADL